MRLRATALILLIVPLLLLPACEQEPAAAPPAEAQAPPARLICMAPNIVETVFALGEGDRVLGVASFTTWPEEATELPDVGALYDPDLERIVALKPDLMIIQQKHEKVEALCAERGIEVMIVDMGRVAGVFEGIRRIGRRLDAEDRAEALCDEIESDLAAVAERIGDGPPVATFLCVDRQPGTLKGLFTVGGESFLSEMLAIAGGRNIFADVSRDYFQPSLEALVARGPEAIIELRPSQAQTEEAKAKLFGDWQALKNLPAVESGRIAVLTEEYIVLPGPRMARIAERLAEVLHGDADEE